MKEKFLYDFYFDNDILEDAGAWYEGCESAEEAEVAATAQLFLIRGDFDTQYRRRNETAPDFSEDDYVGYEPESAEMVIKRGIEEAEKQKISAMAFIERANRILDEKKIMIVSFRLRFFI